jgi:hypothetical protein
MCLNSHRSGGLGTGVTDESETGETGAEPASGTDPAAMALALGAASRAATPSEKSELSRFSHV